MSAAPSLEHRVLSRPIKLVWAGWETDTYRLQQAGWRLSVDQDFYGQRMRIMMSHSVMQMQAICDEVAFDYYRAAMDWEGLYIRDMVVPCQAMGRTVQIHMHGTSPIFDRARPIDAQMQMVQNNLSDLHQLVHFAPALTRTHELILPEAEVPDLIQAILERQDPDRQKRLREALRAEQRGVSSAGPGHEFCAQIIAFKEAA